MPVTLLITRPAEAAARFAAPYGDLPGLSVVCAPVVGLRDVPAPLDPGDFDTVILSSRAAVQRAVAILQGRRYSAYCVGAETAKAARDAGFALRAQAPTAQALTEQIQSQKPTGKLMHLRGRHSTGSMAKTLSSAGIACAETVIYEQFSRELSLNARELLQSPGFVIAPVFSRFGARALSEQLHDIAVHIAVVAISAPVANAWRGPDPILRKLAETPDGAAMHTAVRRALVAVQRLEAGQGKS